MITRVNLVSLSIAHEFQYSLLLCECRGVRLPGSSQWTNSTAANRLITLRKINHVAILFSFRGLKHFLSSMFKTR